MLNNLYRIAIVSLLIFVGGWLGLKMTVPPGYASPLWPPAGIAFAALMLGGKQLWPAIWLGSFVNNLLAGIEISGQLSASVLASSTVIGLGSTVQALTALWLSKRLIHPLTPPLDTPRQILAFFAAVGPLSCLVAPCIGISGLFLLDLLKTTEVWVSWWSWWIGDSLGVLLITPLIFSLLARPRSLWRPRLLRVAVPLLGTLLALATAFVFVFRAEQARIQLAFDNQASAIENLVLEYINNIEDSSHALSDIFLASGHVDRAEFSLFARGLLNRHQEIQALEWLPKVTAEQLPAFEQAVRAEGFADFKVTERADDGSLQAVTPRGEYFPILYVEPMAGNEKAFGLDSTANPQSRASKQWARDHAKPSVSERLTLAQRGDSEAGVLLSIPVYGEVEHETHPERLTGFISTVLLPARTVQLALQGFDSRLFGLTLTDLLAAPDRAELFVQPVSNSAHRSYGLKHWQRDFPFCDRTWRLEITADASFIAKHGSILPWASLLGGLCFTSLLAVLLLTITGHTALAEALVDARTSELEAANAELKAVAGNLQASEAKLRTLIESQPECVKLLASDGTLLEMNQAGLNLIDADSLEQVKGQDVLPLVQPQYQDAFRDSIRKVFAGDSATLEFEIVSLKGIHRWLDTHAVPLYYSDGNIAALLATTRDISQRKAAEEQLKLAARVFGEAHEGILITDAHARIIDVNPTFCDITGYSRDEIIGKNPSVLQSGKHGGDFYQEMWQSLLSNRHWQGEVWNRRKDGELYAELLTVSTLCNEQGEILYYVGLFSDITQSKQQQHMLELMAHYDPLTGLPNRTLFADRLLHAIAHSRREKSLLAICFLDLDGFKPVNDQFGHEAGDQVLVEVAERIRASAREDDSMSRHGGDEFTLLLGNLHSVEECEQSIARIHQAITQPYFVDGQTVNIGVSSGMTIFPLDDADPDTLLRHADHAMYQAKLAGKNCYQLFDPGQDKQVMDKHKHLREIEAAFEQNQFILYYQPKVDLRSGQVVGAEALIRWRHPEYGMMPPMEFLPVIASSELEIRIGNWVMEQAWRQLGDWYRQGLQLEVSVNISAYHLLWKGFTEHLENLLATAPHIASRYLQLEILESTALDDLSAVNRVVRACRNVLGVTTALDDFGTGYSSLAHLRHLPVDTVKIDKGFVRDMLDDPDDYAIVESVIGLSHAFRREVIAEGVENHQQGTVLLLLGCHLAQGYAIAKPMPGEQIAAWAAGYRAHPEWADFANAEMSTEQTLIMVRRIDLQHWLNRIEACLNTEYPSVSHWPIMDPSKTHFGRWLRQAHYHHNYDRRWLEQITALHRELLWKGNVLMHQFWEGDADAARAGFSELRSAHLQLDEKLRSLA